MHRYLLVLTLFVIALPIAAQRYFPIKVDQQWGLINADGEVVQEPIYDAIGEFKQFGYAVMQRQGKVGLLGQNGREILRPQYEDLKVLDSTLIAVMDQGAWMVVNLHGTIILDKGYEKVQVWDNRYLAYRKEGRWGLRNKFGHELAPAAYDALQFEDNGFFLTIKEGKVGLLSSTGREILTNRATEIRFYSDSLFFFREDRLWGAVDFYGIETIPLAYRSYQSMANGFIKLVNERERQVYSVVCRRVLQGHDFDDFYPFSPRYLIVKKDRQLGLMNWCGQLVLPPLYDEIQAYEDRLFRARKNGRWGVVQDNGNVIIPFEYEYIAPLRQQICVVKKQGRFGIANLRGEEVVAPSYKRIELDGRQAKAYRSDQGSKGGMTLLRFDESGNLRDTSRLQRHFEVTIAGATAKGDSGQDGFSKSNYLLEHFEWFYSPEEDRWGLRRLADGSVQIDAKFHSVKVERELGFTIVGIPQSEQYQFGQTNFRFDMTYGLVNNELGLLVTELEFWDIREEDFKQGNTTARCVFTNGRHGLIDRQGRIVRSDLAYLGEFVNGIARFSFTGQLSGDPKADYPLGKLRHYLNEVEAPSVMVDYTQHDQLFRQQAYLYCEGCEWGYMNSEGQVTVPPTYTFAQDFVNDVGIVACDGKWGMVNQNAQTVLPCEYDEVRFLENTDNRIVKVYVNEPKYGLIDTLGQLRVSAAYDEIGSYNDGRLAVRRNGLWGFVNTDGLEVIPCRFREVQNFSEGLAAARLGSGWGIIDKQGRIVIDFQYPRMGSFNNGLAWVSTPDGVGYINREGEVAIPPKFDRAHDFQQGIARVMVNKAWGLINVQGKYIQRPHYIDIQAFNQHGLAIVQEGNNHLRYGLIDRNGNMVSRQTYREIQAFSEGLAAVRQRDDWGYIDTLGNWVINEQFSKAAPFSEGMAVVQIDGQCGYINRAGTLVIPCEYSKCLDFNDGRAVVYQGIRRAGLVNKSGKLLFEPSVNRLINFQEGRGLVRDDQYRFYYITEQASAYNGLYQDASEFKHGVAVVQVNGKWGIINQRGIEIIPPKYDKIESFENGFAKVRIKGFNGLANIDGELIVRPNYEYISYAGEGLFRVEKGDKIGYFDLDGEWVWDIER
jgi:hypothetical protein